MSIFAPAFAHIKAYQAINKAASPDVKNVRINVQHWQKNRMQKTHADLFGKKNHQLMTQYFLTRLYGSNDFDQLSLEIERLLNHSQKLERLIPEQAANTGILSVEVALKAVELDHQIAEYLVKKQGTNVQLTEDVMVEAYRTCNQENTRREQLNQLVQFGQYVDKYANSFLILSAFKLAKGSAHKHNLGFLYDFMGEGFAAVKPLDSAQSFLIQFREKELKIIDAVHAGQANPFTSV